MDEAESFVQINFLHLCFQIEKKFESCMNNFIYREIIVLHVLDLLHI